MTFHFIDRCNLDVTLLTLLSSAKLPSFWRWPQLSQTTTIDLLKLAFLLAADKTAGFSLVNNYNCQNIFELKVFFIYF